MTEHTHSDGGPRGPFKALSRMARLGDIPVVVMLAWAGWLAVPWSFSGLAQARAAAAAAAAEAEPPSVISSDAVRGGALSATDTVRGGPHETVDAVRGGALSTPDTVWTGTPTTADAIRPGPHATIDAVRGGPHATATPARAWGIPAAHSPTPAPCTVRAFRDGSPGDGPREDVLDSALCDDATVRPLREEDSTASVWPLREDDAATAVGLPLREQGAPQASGWAAADVLATERARIAGEVHDAAGHGLAAIALQAGLALITLDDDPEQARASLLAIKETSTTALTQLRAALDRLDPRDSTRDPRAGAHDLSSLIDGVRAAGLPVDVEPADPAVPTHLSATVYGVVRESLTNVLRHAGPTRALVRLSGDPAGFVLEIADHGAGRPGATEERAWSGRAEGRGLAGMRARVTAAGGHFTAGPRVGGGFQVLATFPQKAASPSAAFQNTSNHQSTPDSPADLT